MRNGAAQWSRHDFRNSTVSSPPIELCLQSKRRAASLIVCVSLASHVCSMIFAVVLYIHLSLLCPPGPLLLVLLRNNMELKDTNVKAVILGRAPALPILGRSCHISACGGAVMGPAVASTNGG